MSFKAFLKKEIYEILKTVKIIVLPVLFLFFGILSPLSAKYMNQVLAMAGEQQGIKIILPDPTYIQSYEQLFKNIYFMMIVVIILVFAGSIAEEKIKGTAILALTKNLSRTGFVLGKVIAAALLFTFSYIVGVAVFLYYTSLLFPVFISSGAWIALLCFWVFGIFIISLTFLSSIIGKSFTSAAVGGFIGYAGISAFAAMPYAGKFSPGILQTLSVELVMDMKTPADAAIPLVIAFALAIAAVAGGIIIFRKQEL